MFVSAEPGSESRYDAVLVGAGIMGATLAVLLHELDPEIRLLMVERLNSHGLESTAAVNNAGTGHAANCELNYTPIGSDGLVATAKAFEVNAAFEQSLSLWGSLVAQEKLQPQKFLHQVPHISVVWGDEDIEFLRQRYRQLSEATAFSDMQWSEDFEELSGWMPLVMEGQSVGERVAATRVKRGTDVDFGELTNAYLTQLKTSGGLDLLYSTEVHDLNRVDDQYWQLDLQGPSGSRQVQAPFVFLGAGGWTLPLLQRSGIKEGKSYGGFPVSGQWLVCSDPVLVNRHHAKVYGKAKVGAPPMSVPHLDSRWIDGRRSLLFGPYAGFSSNFLKQGSRFDLLRSIKPNNVLPMLNVGITNIDLVRYLLAQLRQSQEDRFTALQEYLPRAHKQDWNLAVAGQRVQIIKQTAQGGRLQMGTEVVTAADGSLAALLGASPGASTAVTIMLQVLQRCWGERMASRSWNERLQKLLPSYGKELSSEPNLLMKIRKRNDELLNLA